MCDEVTPAGRALTRSGVLHGHRDAYPRPFNHQVRRHLPRFKSVPRHQVDAYRQLVSARRYSSAVAPAVAVAEVLDSCLVVSAVRTSAPDIHLVPSYSDLVIEGVHTDYSSYSHTAAAASATLITWWSSSAQTSDERSGRDSLSSY